MNIAPIKPKEEAPPKTVAQLDAEKVIHDLDALLAHNAERLSSFESLLVKSKTKDQTIEALGEHAPEVFRRLEIIKEAFAKLEGK